MVGRTAQVFGYEKVCGQQAAPLGSALIRCGNQVFARFCKTSVKSWKNPVTFRPALASIIIGQGFDNIMYCFGRAGSKKTEYVSLGRRIIYDQIA